MITVCMIAGKGINGRVVPVVRKYLESQFVNKVFVSVGKNSNVILSERNDFPDKQNDPDIVSNSKIQLVEWEGEDDHSHLSRMRNKMMDLAKDYVIDWIINCDDDGMPDDNYLEILDSLHPDVPVVMTGKLYNADGHRYWDLGYSDGKNFPFLLPYDNWEDEQFQSYIYFNGNQHIMNKAAFDLGVRYRPYACEDTWFCRDVRDAGATVAFCPDLKMKLTWQHPGVGPGPYYNGID